MPTNRKILIICAGVTTILIVAAIGAYFLFFANKKEAAPTVTQTPTKKEAKVGGDLSDRIDLKTVKLTGTGTQGLDVDPETGYVYLGNNGSVISKCQQIDQNAPGRDTLSIVDPAKEKEIANVKSGGAPIWPQVDVKRDVVYLANSGTSDVVVHKRGTGEKLQSIRTGGLPHESGLYENLLVVSNTFDQSQTYYSVINVDTRQVVGNYKSPRLPHPIVVDAENKIAYMMGVEDASVAIIDMTTGKTRETIKFEGGGGQLEISKKRDIAFTDSSQPGSSAAAFDLKTQKLLGTISFPELNAPGTGLAIDEEAGLLFVVIGDQNAIGVASTETLKALGYFKVGGCPYAVKIDAKRNLGFVSNSGDGTLSIFDLKKVREGLGK